MKIIEIELKELRNIGNFEHRAFGLKVAIDGSESVAETLEAMEAFVKLETEKGVYDRVKLARENVFNLTDESDYRLRESRNVLEKWEPLIKLAEKLGYKP